MDKKDITYIIAAFCIIFIIAFVIKPLATGQPVNTGIPVATTTVPIINETPAVVYSNIASIVSTPSPISTPTTWNQKAQTVGFVNPESYHLSTNSSLPQGTRINATSPDTNRSVYATISGKYSGTTQIINIPFPYWELSYTIDPQIGPMSGSTAVPSEQFTPTLGNSYSHSGVSGSYSAVNPMFSIQVMDATDPNRIVRSITPPGGIDPNLWAGILRSTPEVTRTTQRKYAEIAATPTITYTDPRPWTEKFYEGQRSYYFIINSQYIDSYTIKILVPTKYIGKY